MNRFAIQIRPSTAPGPSPGPSHGTRRCAGFTLTELLVVIALIALLVALLLAALGQVQAKARSTSTLATMQSFANACEAFQQEHGFYPGVVPEAVMAFHLADSGEAPPLSSTENAMLHLIGGYVREEDVGSASFNADYPDGDGWETITVTGPAGGYDIKVNRRRLGDGPIINDKPFAPYFTPGNREIGVTEGQLPDDNIDPADDNIVDLPDLLDAWGQPIIFLRQLRSVGPLTRANSNVPPQFEISGLTPYTGSTALGRFGIDQNEFTILPTVDTADDMVTLQNFERIVRHPALDGQTRGAFVMISAGPDGKFFSKDDGPGTSSNPVDDLENANASPQIIEEYDDVLLFGGG